MDFQIDTRVKGNERKIRINFAESQTYEDKQGKGMVSSESNIEIEKLIQDELAKCVGQWINK